ncbi:hypothetical protein HDU67_002497 [Dinochytrium kinnereticum]|nr:hypothetical protein HDU67_002497 [Dinochytrium kinnereticum]
MMKRWHHHKDKDHSDHDHHKHHSHATGTGGGGSTVATEEDLKAFPSAVRKHFHAHAMLATMSDEDFLRFLNVNRGNQAAALKQIGVTLDWREGYKWSTLLDEDFSDESKVGKLSIFGHDLDGHPIAVWKQARHRPDDFGLERDIRYIIYTVEKAKKMGIVKDRISLIIDRIGMTNHNFDSPLMKTLLSTFQTYYPDHLARLFVFPKNMLLSVGFNVAKVFLDLETVERIKILTEEEHKHCLMQYIDKEKLFKRFGGTVDDPFDLGVALPSSSHLSDSDDQTEPSSPTRDSTATKTSITVSPRTSSTTTAKPHTNHPSAPVQKRSTLRLLGGRTSFSTRTSSAAPVISQEVETVNGEDGVVVASGKIGPPPPRVSSVVGTPPRDGEEEGGSLRPSTVGTLASVSGVGGSPGGKGDDVSVNAPSVGDSAVSVG